MKKILSAILTSAIVTAASLPVMAQTTSTSLSFESLERNAIYEDPEIGPDEMGFGDVQLRYCKVHRAVVMPVAIGNNDITALRAEVARKASVTVNGNQISAIKVMDGLRPASVSANKKCGQEFSTEAQLSMVSNNLIVWRITDYMYAGGAHGGAALDFVSYYVPTNTVLKLTSLLRPGYERQTNKLIREWLRESSYAEWVNDINSVTTPKNFYVNANGQLVFVFGQYEIAPYAAGIIEVPLQSYQLESILTPLGKKVLPSAE